MPKLGMAPVRRKQLIDATYVVLHRDGIDDLTLKKIAEEAGVATSIITHYFGTKEALIAATMSDLVASFLREVRDRRKLAKTKIDEVVAIVDGNFAPSQVSPVAISAWLYFWSRVPYDVAFDRMQRACDYQLRKYLAKSLKDIVLKDQADDIADTIVCLSYGFWLQFAHRQRDFDVARAHRMALQVIEARIQMAWQSNLHLSARPRHGDR